MIVGENGKLKNLLAPVSLPQFKGGKTEEDIAKIAEVSNPVLGS